MMFPGFPNLLFGCVAVALASEASVSCPDDFTPLQLRSLQHDSISIAKVTVESFRYRHYDSTRDPVNPFPPAYRYENTNNDTTHDVTVCLPEGPMTVNSTLWDAIFALTQPWIDCHAVTVHGLPENEMVWSMGEDDDVVVVLPVIAHSFQATASNGDETVVTVAYFGTECIPTYNPHESGLFHVTVETAESPAAVDVRVMDQRSGRNVVSCRRHWCAPDSGTFYSLYKVLNLYGKDGVFHATVDIADADFTGQVNLTVGMNPPIVVESPGVYPLPLVPFTGKPREPSMAPSNRYGKPTIAPLEPSEARVDVKKSIILSLITAVAGVTGGICLGFLMRKAFLYIRGHLAAGNHNS